MNVALARVLYANALAAAPRLALGRFAAFGRLLGDPRLGIAGVFLSLRRVLPNRYPLAHDIERYIADEQRLGRMLDYAVIVPRLQCLYEWSAAELGELRLLGLVRDGNPIYAWPFEQRHMWRAPKLTFAGRVLERVTRQDVAMTEPLPGTESTDAPSAAESSGKMSTRRGVPRGSEAPPSDGDACRAGDGATLSELRRPHAAAPSSREVEVLTVVGR